MYETHWHLEQKPFENTLDPRFYFPGEPHQAALLKLRYAVESRRSAALLAGMPGSGKSLLVGLLRQMLSEQFRPFVHLVFPQMPLADLLAYLAGEMGGGTPAGLPSPQESVRRIEQLLGDNVRAGRHAVVAIDESHLLDDGQTLETLRLLLNLEPGGRPALTLLLVGQTGLLPVLDRMPQLEERLAVKCLLRPLTAAETAEYVRHRLRAAGAQAEIFEPEALATLHELTHGVARRINRLCDLALLIAYAEGQSIITASTLESVCDELVNVAPE